MKLFKGLFLLLAVATVSARRIERKGDDPRIVGGVEAEPNSVPYQIALKVSSSEGLFCGGWILDETHVGTAAHCCAGRSPSSVLAVAGDHSLHVNEDTEQAFTASEIIMHEDYGSYDLINDVCLIKINGQFEFNDAVQPANMPVQAQEFEAGSMSTVTGWGDLTSGGSMSVTLQTVDIPVISDEECRDLYPYNTVQDSAICTLQTGKDACQGDSGGPLTCGEDRILCGLVSWGIGCAGEDSPGVYMQVSYYVDWLNDNL